MKAWLSGTDDGRMSWPTITVDAAGEPGEGVADLLRDGLVELVGIDARARRTP